ncbi:MAG: L-lactate permease [Rhodospirillales bacterium]|nr:L-lactate permease [Rhodospirillales bacterium]
MYALAAASPIILSTVLIVLFRQPALRGGMVGMVLAIAISLALPAFLMPAAALAGALGKGLLITANVSYVLLGGVALSQVLRGSGALDVIARTLTDAIPDPGRRTLVLVLGLSVFFESATGFGIGIIVAAPVFLALGLPARQAGFLALLGQCAVPWGALGIGTTLGSELTGVPEATLGVLAAPLTAPLVVLCGGIALWIIGGWNTLRRRWFDLLALSALLLGTLAIGSRLVGIELAGTIAGLIVAAVGWAFGGKARISSSAARRLAHASAPLILLLVTLLVTRLTPPLRDWLLAHAIVDVPSLGFRLSILYHPGFWMLASAAAIAPFASFPAATWAIQIQSGLRQWMIATLAVAGFLCMSQVMFAAGMTAQIATFVVGATGSSYILLLPFIGGVGGFLTASNAGSNALFAQLQITAADALGMPHDLTAAAQNAAGANTTLASPGRVVLAATSVGLLGRESELMRPVLIVAGIGLAAMSAILWLWILP